jgi:hypothetical protein
LNESSLEAMTTDRGVNRKKETKGSLLSY